MIQNFLVVDTIQTSSGVPKDKNSGSGGELGTHLIASSNLYVWDSISLSELMAA